MWKRSVSLLSLMAMCLAAGPVVALGVVTGPLSEAASILQDLGEHLAPTVEALQSVESSAAGRPASNDLSGANVSDAPEATERLASESLTSHSNIVGPRPVSVAATPDSSPTAPRSVALSSTTAPLPPRIAVLPISDNAPPCPGVYVYIVSDWVDGGAVATMAVGKKSRGRPRRVGNTIGGYEVVAIGSLGYGRGPTVWLAKGHDVCQVKLSADNPVRERRRVAIRAPSKKKAKARKAKSRKAKSRNHRRRNH